MVNDIREKTGLNEIVPQLEDVSLLSVPPAETQKLSAGPSQCWTRRSGVKLQDLDARTVLGTKDHFLPVLEHRLLSEGSG